MSSVIYSIIETAKEDGLKPFEYLKHVFETMPNIPADSCKQHPIPNNEQLNTQQAP